MVAVVVEGQTEEAFVKGVLAPYLWNRDVQIIPIIVETSRAAGGHKFKGGGTWDQYRRDVRRLLNEPHWQLVTTMIDFYGFPRDAPGAVSATPLDARECARERQRALEADLGDERFSAFVMLHEFETLVFAAAQSRLEILGSAAVASALKEEASQLSGDVELLNDSPDTAPSKRVGRLWPSYAKVTDGVAVVDEAGIEAVAAVCPGFAAWVEMLISGPSN